MTRTSVAPYADRTVPDFWHVASAGGGLEAPARQVGDWFSPQCPPCLDAYVLAFGLDHRDEAIVRYAIDNVECPAGWYGPNPDRAYTTMRAMAARLRMHVDTLRRRLRGLEGRGLVLSWFPPGRGGGWVRAVHYPQLVDLPPDVRAARLGVRLRIDRAERIDRRRVERTYGPHGLDVERVAAERIERTQQVHVDLSVGGA